MVSHNLEYDKRIKIFEQYIKNDIRINDGNCSQQVIDTIRRLIIILFIPCNAVSLRNLFFDDDVFKSIMTIIFNLFFILCGC
jgi:hypothetical protein